MINHAAGRAAVGEAARGVAGRVAMEVMLTARAGNAGGMVVLMAALRPYSKRRQEQTCGGEDDTISANG